MRPQATCHPDKVHKAHGLCGTCLSAKERKARTPEKQKGYRLKCVYSITLEQWQAMYEAQGGRCGICHNLPDDPRGLAVDHDHACCPGPKSCGRCVRGLLCFKCNRIVGLIGEANIMKFAENAQDYLQEAAR